MNKTKIALGLVALLGAASAMAQSAPNPLMRPAQQAAARPQGLSAPPSAGDMAAMLNAGAAGPDGGKNDKSDERVKAAQNTLYRYNVVAIQGDTAVLRVTSMAVSAPAGGSGSGGLGSSNLNQGGSQGGSQGASLSGSATPDAGYGVLPSMVVKHKQKTVIQDVEAVAEVQNGQVTLRTADGKRALYTGRLDGNGGRQYRGFIWVTPDAAYTSRQSPPVSKNAAGTTSGSTSGSSGGGTGVPATSTNF